MAVISIRTALERVAKNPIRTDPNDLEVKTHEMVCRALFQIANSPNRQERGSFARATKAQKMILDRLVGRRRAGTHPVQNQQETLSFTDLTMGSIE